MPRDSLFDRRQVWMDAVEVAPEVGRGRDLHPSKQAHIKVMLAVPWSGTVNGIVLPCEALYKKSGLVCVARRDVAEVV